MYKPESGSIMQHYCFGAAMEIGIFIISLVGCPVYDICVQYHICEGIVALVKQMNGSNLSVLATCTKVDVQ